MTFSFHYTTPTSNHVARIGTITTPHGIIETPAFIFCATKAAMKGVDPAAMKQANTQIILSNTYHLMLQPGAELVERMGGLHTFMGWNGPMLTDSGGFQIFSLGHGSVAEEIKGKRNTHRPKTLRKITEEGAAFQSYLDGKHHMLTPERSIQIQRSLGADLILVFDECTPFHVEKSYTERSMHLSHRWGLRSLDEFNRTMHKGDQRLYGIVQGGVHADLRKQSAAFVTDNPFFGNAVGGSLGATKEQMYDVVSVTMENLDRTRPTHLLGIGGIRDIFEGVKHGIDTFDCVHPTRLARHGGALVRAQHWQDSGRDANGHEHINLRNAHFRDDQAPIDTTCGCTTCASFSRGYLHHLLKAKELLALSAITIHNVFFMNRLMEAVRSAIRTNTLDAERKHWLAD